MAKWATMYSSDYLNAAELEGKKVTLSIARVEGRQLENEKGGMSGKAIVIFREEGRKPWVMAKVNARCLAAMFGDECDGWANKRVTLHSEMVKVGKENALGIRVIGSPDISKPVTVTIKDPRKRPYTMVMQPTGIKANGSARPVASAAPTPEDDPPPPEDASENEPDDAR
jgi:hypothetical protein